jgi:hypothetical protein
MTDPLRELLEDISEMSPEDFASHEVKKRIDAALAQIKEAGAQLMKIEFIGGYPCFECGEASSLTVYGPPERHYCPIHSPFRWVYAAPQPPASSNQENAGRKTRQPEETRGLLGASELSGDEHQMDDPQQVGSQPPAGKSEPARMPSEHQLYEKVGPEQQSVDFRKALNRAWQMGQTYFSQADSESIAANKRSDRTMEQFKKFVEETVAAATPADAIPREIHDRLLLEAYREALRVAYKDLWNTEPADRMERLKQLASES